MQVLEITGLFAHPRGGYFVDFFAAVDLSADRLFAHRSLSKTETVRKSRTVIEGLPALRGKKTLTPQDMRASPNVSLSTGSVFFLPRDAATLAAPFSQKR